MDISILKQTFKGEIIAPGDSSYEVSASTLYFKGSPALIVRPLSAEDVATAISFAQEHSLPLSVRSGGHSVSGFSTNKDGMVIDMSSFNTVEVTDEEKNLVKVGTGARWGEVAAALSKYGLVISSGDTSSVGVGGLTLGGGIGWMVRKYGLTIDSLVGADIVTSDGTFLHLSETENADLFWAIRGGGGNFGIVTSFEFKAHKETEVYAGMISYTLDNLSDLIKGWADYMKKAPEELTSFFMVMPPMGGQPAGVINLVCFAGDQTEGEKAMAPLLTMGTVVHKDLQMKPYAQLLADVHPPQGVEVIVKNGFIEHLNDDIINLFASVGGKEGSPFIVLRSLGGAMARIPEEATAFAARTSDVMVLAPFFIPLNDTGEARRKALETWDKIKSYSEGAYCGFLSDPKENISSIYLEKTYKRLLEIKKKYDPENIFDQNFNVK